MQAYLLERLYKSDCALEKAFGDMFSQRQSVCEIVGKRLQGKVRGIHDLSQLSLGRKTQPKTGDLHKKRVPKSSITCYNIC